MRQRYLQGSLLREANRSLVAGDGRGYTPARADVARVGLVAVALPIATGDGEMKRVYIARGTAEAHLVRAFLEAEGIEAIVRGEHLSAIFGGIPIDKDSLPSVWIADEAEYDRAMALVEETSRAAAEKAEPGEPGGEGWICPGCGERIDGRSLVCWSCGSERGIEA